MEDPSLFDSEDLIAWLLLNGDLPDESKCTDLRGCELTEAAVSGPSKSHSKVTHPPPLKQQLQHDASILFDNFLIDDQLQQDTIKLGTCS